MPFFYKIMKILYKLLKRLLWKIGDSVEAKGSFPFGNCIVRYALTDNGDEIEIYNPAKGTFMDNVSEWLLLNIGDRCTQSFSEWNEHGFRDESDYLKYKFG